MSVVAKQLKIRLQSSPCALRIIASLESIGKFTPQNPKCQAPTVTRMLLIVTYDFSIQKISSRRIGKRLFAGEGDEKLFAMLPLPVALQCSLDRQRTRIVAKTFG